GYLGAALGIAREIGFRTAEANALYQLGIAAFLRIDPEAAREYLTEALAVFRATNDARGQVPALRQLAAVQVALGNPNEALQSITEGLEKLPVTSAASVYAGSVTLANVYDALGDAEKARARYKEAIDRARQNRAREYEAAALTIFGRFLAKH